MTVATQRTKDAIMDGPADAGGGASFTQTGRLIAIDTVLGPDALLLTELVGEEALSELFSFEATMISRNQGIAPEALVGTNATLWFTRREGTRTPVNGHIRRLSVGRVVMREFREYRAEIVPWLWFLTRTTDCRIFQDKTVPQVIAEVFDDHGFTQYDLSGLTDTYPALDYIVQYRESAFDFVSRWMEEVGISYFFRHEAGKHTLVLADHNVSYKPADEAEVGYDDYDGGEVSRWQHGYDYRSGAWAQKDFNFETPAASLLTTQKSLLKLPGIGTWERFDYPGRYADTGYGQSLTRVRIEDEEAAFHRVEGASLCASFRTGSKFTLVKHNVAAEVGRSYVLARIRHQAAEHGYFGDDQPADAYTNSFTAFPAETRRRPPRITPRPVVHGPQTATVVGPAGETIYPDRYGRVKLQFHWDRRGKSDEKSSCWVRVAQPWGGGGWGGMFIPHVGHEVVVSFLEGDPDRPMVTGRVYNANTMQAIGLPANKTQSAWRDHTGNEILMEGKAGIQDIRVTAVKDMNLTVEHDHNDVVKTGNRTIAVQSGTHTETIKGDTSVTVTDGAYSHLVKANTASRVSKAASKLQSQEASIDIEAATTITLHVGASTLTMDSAGNVTLKGTNITIDGSGEVVIRGGMVYINSK